VGQGSKISSLAQASEQKIGQDPWKRQQLKNAVKEIDAFCFQTLGSLDEYNGGGWAEQGDAC
jgi:hypothetical protein